MSGEGTFPFDPERLVALGKLAAEINGRVAPPAFATPIVVSEHGDATLPYTFAEGALTRVQICAGISLGWATMPETDAVLLSLWGGTPETAPSHFNVTTTLTRAGFRALIADLQAIDAALEAM